MIVQSDTVIRRHREGIKLYWHWKSRAGEVGRPKIEADIRRLIRRRSRENPSCGVPRILRLYFDDYLYSRTHLSLDRSAPVERQIERPHLSAQLSRFRKSAA